LQQQHQQQQQQQQHQQQQQIGSRQVWNLWVSAEFLWHFDFNEHVLVVVLNVDDVQCFFFWFMDFGNWECSACWNLGYAEISI
jgi:hypothetical protein